jgi:predicted flavoprotein YhiN
MDSVQCGSAPLPRLRGNPDMPDWDVVIIGAGAAGLLAAIRAAERGRRTLLVEKNRKPGVKILMSGGTRCNLTQNTDARGIVEAYGRPGRFLHSALASLGPRELVELIEAEGVPTKIEATGKIFPASDKAVDVLNALLHRLNRSGATLLLDEPVGGLERVESAFRVVTTQRTLTVPRVLLTTGGRSYPGCGTTGDGYAWAHAFGHTIVPPRPALVPVTTTAVWVHQLSGLTIPDVAVRVVPRDDSLDAGAPSAQVVADSRETRKSGRWRNADVRRGSFLFTHFGASGPAVLDVSRDITALPDPACAALECDFLPELTDEQFETELRARSAAAGRKAVVAILPDQVPRRLTEALLEQAAIPAEQRAAELSRDQRARIVRWFKQARIPVSGTRGFEKAEVTAGGVSLDEVDSHTMESRLVPGLFFAGEILDLDGPIGGYNFQAAFSTGHLAGEHL